MENTVSAMGCAAGPMDEGPQSHRTALSKRIPHVNPLRRSSASNKMREWDLIHGVQSMTSVFIEYRGKRYSISTHHSTACFLFFISSAGIYIYIYDSNNGLRNQWCDRLSWSQH